jgi:hypothetical protein
MVFLSVLVFQTVYFAFGDLAHSVGLQQHNTNIELAGSGALRISIWSLARFAVFFA